MTVEREYRKRRKAPTGPFIVMGLVALNTVFQTSRPSSIPFWARVGFLALMVAAFAWMILSLWRGRTLITADGITARKVLTERHWAWHDIYDIRAFTIRNAPGKQRKCVAHLYDTDGRRHLLPQLDDWQLDDPWTEVAGLRDEIAQHRGLAWERRPAVEAVIRRRAGHRKAWERAVTGAVISLVCGFLVWVVLMFTLNDVPPMLLFFLYLPLTVFALLAAVLNWRWESQVPKELREAGREP